jgi:protoporphyrinogen oxidase
LAAGIKLVNFQQRTGCPKLTAVLSLSNSFCLAASFSSKVYPQESGQEQRTVIVEFDSYESALAAYDSEAYKKALRALGSGAERDSRIAEGA